MTAIAIKTLPSDAQIIGSLPVINFTTKKEVVEALHKLGRNENEVFLKTYSEDMSDAWGSKNVHRQKSLPLRIKLGYSESEYEQLWYNEITQLYKISSIIPDNSSRPIAIAKINGEFRGYFSTMVEGNTLDYCISKELIRDTDGIFDQVLALLGRLHQNGIGHGDLNTKNVVWDGKKVVFIDPAKTLGKDDQNLIELDALMMIPMQESLVHSVEGYNRSTQKLFEWAGFQTQEYQGMKRLQ